MRVENNIDYGVKNKNIYKNNIQYRNLKSEPDTVSFGANLNKPAKGFLGKLKDIILSPINTMKKHIEQAKLGKQAKLEAERKAAEAAKKAEDEAYLKRKLAEIAEKKESYARVLREWKSRHSGVRKIQYPDNTGDVKEVRGLDPVSDDALFPPPKRGQYDLSNILGGGYSLRRGGYGTFYLRDKEMERPIYFERPTCIEDIPNTSNWEMQKNMVARDEFTGKLRTYTMLSKKFNEYNALQRPSALNICIEGDISPKEINEIKENIVKKGLWEDYMRTEDQDELIGIYNEILNYLNK